MGICFCPGSLARFPPPVFLCLFCFLFFCYSSIFDKLARRFSNAKFTYLGYSKNPRATSEQSCSEVESPAGTFAGRKHTHSCSLGLLEAVMASKGSLDRQSEARESAIFKQTIRERTGIYKIAHFKMEVAGVNCFRLPYSYCGNNWVV